MSDNWLYRFKRKIIAGLILLLAVSMTSAMIFVIMMMRSSLISESAENARQLGRSISSSLKSQMITRSPEQLQNSISELGRNGHIAKVFILNKSGRIDYSSDKAEIGKQLDLAADSCRGCHQPGIISPVSTTTILRGSKGDLQRNITVIYNEPACYSCHSKSERINGKLIIDYPLDSTYALIRKIQIIILTSAFICLLLLIPFLSRMINRYIDEITLKNFEINLIYTIINNISKSINMEELKHIVLDIISDALSAEEVDIALPRSSERGYRIITRSLTGEKVLRKAVAAGDPLIPVLERWLSGDLLTQEISSDRSEVYLPIAKGGIRLALITARNKKQPFQAVKLKLLEAISNHIAIAFENARLYAIAITDELTGLYTVRHFRHCIDRQIGLFEHYGENLALLMIDIDNFKRINDTHGHVTGDFVLRQVAEIISESVRSEDLTFRYGGEEFCIILPATASQGALLVAERIRSQIEAAEIITDGVRLNVTVSIGLALCPDNSASARDLVVEADKAMYVAKKSGKNRIESSCTVAGEV